MSPKTRHQRLLGYIRVSRMKDEGISPDLQRAAIEAYATAHGHDVLFLDPDLDESGKSLDRPTMQAALAKLKAGEADGIIAAKLDRLTRRVGDLGRLLDLAVEHDFNIVAIDLGLDLTTSNGKLVANLLGSVAEWELDRRREGWREARTSAIGRGAWAASRVPAGYVKDAKTKVLRPSEHAPVVRAAAERRAEGGTWSEAASILNEARVPKDAGKNSEWTPWTPQAVAALLENRALLGEQVTKDGIVNLTSHEAILDEGTFARIQARKGENGSFDKAGKTKELLAGLGHAHSLVRCGRCGAAMTSDGRDNPIWRCSARCGDKALGIKAPTVSVKALQRYVLNYVAAHSPGIILGGRSNDAEIRAAQVALDNAQAALDAFTDSFDTSLDPVVLAKMTARYTSERDAAVEALAEAQGASTAESDWAQAQEQRWADEAKRLGLALSEVRAMDGHYLPTDEPITGGSLILLLEAALEKDNAQARRMFAQLVKRIVVHPARAENPTTQPIEERVEITLA